MPFTAAAWPGQTAGGSLSQKVPLECRGSAGFQAPALSAGNVQSSARGFAAAAAGEADAAPRAPLRQQGQQQQQQQPEGRRRGRPKGSGGARASSVKPGEADKFGALAAEWCAATVPPLRHDAVVCKRNATARQPAGSQRGCTLQPQPFRCLCSAVLVHDSSRAWDPKDL